MRVKSLLAAALFVTAGVETAGALVQVGDPAPNLRKAQLAPGPAVGAQVSLADYAGKVVVLAIVGYN